MNTILFNKNYTKLPAGIKTARLVAVEPVRGENQTKAFLDYDTQLPLIPLSELKGIQSFIIKPNQPPTGDYLLLCLISDTGAFFTTLRKDNAENREKYMNKMFWSSVDYKWAPKYGKEFQIIIKEG